MPPVFQPSDPGRRPWPATPTFWRPSATRRWSGSTSWRPQGVNVHVKVESFNPLGSVKDRMARAVIEHAERTGALKPGQTVVEATSGNTGIGLAMVCAQKGYPLVVTMAESFSVERRKLLRFLGARVVLTPAAEKGTGMLNKAIELADTHGWFLCRQFDNEANAEVHTRTTAREILADFAGERIHAFVSGFGTGGTLLGMARGLKAADARIRVVAAEPDNSPLLGSGIAQPRDADGQPSASHPQFRPHLMQGWSPDFVSSLTEKAVAEGLVDEIVPVNGNEAMRLARELATQEGIFVGTSSGATLAAALDVARARARGQPHRLHAARHRRALPVDAAVRRHRRRHERRRAGALALDAGLSLRRGAAAPAAPVVIQQPETAAVLDGDAETLVTEVVRDNAVVMFALEWCEFCWAVRKLFARLGIAYRSVDIDSVAFQQGDMGTKVRAVLKERTGSPTIPQIYIGGSHVGGATDLFDAMRAGRMQQAARRRRRRARPRRGARPVQPAAQVAAPAQDRLMRRA